MSISLAAGRPPASRHSDIVVAILPRGELPSRLFARLEAGIEESAIPDDVDLVDLREVGAAFHVRRTDTAWAD